MTASRFPLRGRRLPLALVFASAAIAASAALPAQQLAPVIYTIRVPDPASHLASIEARFPTAGKDTIDLMMPVWSPGYYRVEDYAGKVQSFAAIGRGGLAPSRRDAAVQLSRGRTTCTAATITR